jgi:hypothetical protein
MEDCRGRSDCNKHFQKAPRATTSTGRVAGCGLHDLRGLHRWSGWRQLLGLDRYSIKAQSGQQQPPAEQHGIKDGDTAASAMANADRAPPPGGTLRTTTSARRLASRYKRSARQCSRMLKGRATGTWIQGDQAADFLKGAKLLVHLDRQQVYPSQKFDVSNCYQGCYLLINLKSSPIARTGIPSIFRCLR